MPSVTSEVSSHKLNVALRYVTGCLQTSEQHQLYTEGNENLTSQVMSLEVSFKQLDHTI